LTSLLLVSEASVEDTNAAVAAAKAAQVSWAKLAPRERGRYMKKVASLIRQSNEELAHLEAISMGRPLKEYFDSTAAAGSFEYFSEAGYLAQGCTSLNMPGYVNMTLRQPFGVVAVIIPWNVPLLFFAKKVAPAIAAGNCVVLKSSEKAPLTVSNFLLNYIIIENNNYLIVCKTCYADPCCWLSTWCY
jgi:aldehyde dehydrogenase (NAD+)